MDRKGEKLGCISHGARTILLLERTESQVTRNGNPRTDGEECHPVRPQMESILRPIRPWIVLSLPPHGQLPPLSSLLVASPPETSSVLGCSLRPCSSADGIHSLQTARALAVCHLLHPSTSLRGHGGVSGCIPALCWEARAQLGFSLRHCNAPTRCHVACGFSLGVHTLGSQAPCVGDSPNQVDLPLI